MRKEEVSPHLQDLALRRSFTVVKRNEAPAVWGLASNLKAFSSVCGTSEPGWPLSLWQNGAGGEG